MTLSADASLRLSLEIRASFELGQMLGQAELIGQLDTSLNELLDHGDESFDISFPPIRGVHLTLTLKAASSIIDSEIARGTDAGHTRFAEYVTCKAVSYLNERFQFVLNRCPVGHSDHAAALTNLAINIPPPISANPHDSAISYYLFFPRATITPDEVIHLAAGLQFSGFKSFIGTLWAVDDVVTKHVVGEYVQEEGRR
ncbi:hypothetical protein DFH29DRAFT_1082031 [Suillus ampliporus]|nr:hypothetical protein DFH29DRAFT_1082031 [Suillus ampliporus]